MRRLIASSSLCAILFLSAGIARAQFFDYSTVFTPNPVPSNQAGSIIPVTNGSNSSGVDGSGVGSDIAMENFSVVSPAADQSPVAVNAGYTISLSLNPSANTGVSTGSTVTKTFTGTLFGTISSSNSSVQNSYNAPLTQNFDFGSAGAFTVALSNYTPPGPPGSNNLGSLGAHVMFASPIGGQSIGTPEPGSVAMLAALSLPGLILLRRRRGK